MARYSQPAVDAIKWLFKAKHDRFPNLTDQELHAIRTEFESYGETGQERDEVFLEEMEAAEAVKEAELNK